MTTPKELIVGRINLYSDWHYPGLEIGPNDGEYTAHLVGNDPLYLVDTSPEVLAKAISQFNPTFQKKIRVYNINISGFVDLPQEAFGLVFSNNTFDYFGNDQVDAYLQVVYSLLLPGGVFMLSTGSNMLIADKALSFGFEVIRVFTEEHYGINWLELKKPGTLKTILAHPTQGQILPISPKNT
jgi:SAM-dependent methyltransferase